MSSDGVQLVKENLGLSQFVGRYTKLVRKGGRMAACCPIHKEKTPSFYVDDSKGFFHCFGCGKGGDLIKFCMEMEGLEFLDALEFLAEIAGVELPKRGKAGPGREVVEKLREINEAAVGFYQNCFANQPAARKYLEERGIDHGTARLFRLGLALSQWDALWLHLVNQYDPRLLMKTGLFKEGRSGKPYDLFRGRIIFPIRDVYGHTVAFGGRLFGEDEGPKYINSPETPLYTKGKHVYNLDFAKVFLKKKPEDGVVVVEGYMDVIQLYQAGVTNVIAGLGTAFTPEQGKLLKRFVKKAVLNYDGDAAGFKAARAAIEIFLPLDLDIRVITLPDKLDPDDFIKQHGVDAYRSRLAEAQDFFNYLLPYLSEGKDVAADPRHRSVVARELVSVVDRIEDPVVHEHYMGKIAEDLALPVHVLEQLHKKTKNKGPAGKPGAAPKRTAPKRTAPKRTAPANQGPHREQKPWQDPSPRGGAPPGATDYGAGAAPGPQTYGSEPLPQQYGRVAEPPPPQYGAGVEPTPMQYGGEPEPAPIQYGGEPEPAPIQYGGEPEPAPPQHGGADAPPISYGEPGAPPDYGPPDDYYEMNAPLLDESDHPPFVAPTEYVNADLGYQPVRERAGSRKGRFKKGEGKYGKRGKWDKWDRPEPEPPPRPKESVFNKMEEEFLYHVMHTPDFTAAVAEEHQEILPKILANVFADRRWVLDFIYTRDFADFSQRLEIVPDQYRGHLAKINFSEEFDEADEARLEQLCPDLLRAMLNRLSQINHSRMRMLPPSEEERKKALMRQNIELRRQASKL